ncbi:DUF4236 domain-containing protein [Streptacidiphilus sp. 4-A2]|nr:DUF4236 domain-containing protein [Streptacidiphilus sp. 4-A2]
MGLSYRKSFKAGPFRVTASKSGISYSAGVKGARVTKRANGKVQTTLSVPGSGVRYTTSSGNKPRTSRRTVRTQALPGRSSLIPQIPPATMRPIAFKGYLATVTLHPDHIDITRTFMGKITGNRSGSVPWTQIVAVDFLEPTVAKNGHIHFATALDPRGLTSTGNGNRMAASARNPHAVMFTWQQRRRYRELRDLLAANAVTPTAVAASMSGRATAVSPVDELAKLGQMFQQGLLSPEEFAAAKARYLRA